MAYRSLRRQTLHYFARPQHSVRRTPLHIPAAWRAPDVANADDWQVQLKPAEVQELQAGLRHAEASGRALEDLRAVDFPLPTLAPKVAAWRREVRHGRGFVLIRGVPVAQWRAPQAEIFFWCFGLHFGIPGAQNPQGDLLGHVRDLHSSRDERYYRTRKDIAMHCDAADVVGLLCLQPAASGGLSRIASSVSVYNEVLRRAPALVEQLYHRIYFDTKGDGGIAAYPIAPCRYAAGALQTFWQSDYFRSAPRHPQVPALTPEWSQLLDLYDTIATSPEFQLQMELKSGDVQLLSNHTQLHSRTAFTDHPEPERQRHLLRLWISLPESRPWSLRWRRWRSHAAEVLIAARELIRSSTT